MSYNSIFYTYKAASNPIEIDFGNTLKKKKKSKKLEYGYDLADFLLGLPKNTNLPKEVLEEFSVQQPEINPYLNTYLPEPIVEVSPANALYETKNNLPSQNYGSLVRIDIEDLLRLEGITKVNGKPIKFGNRLPRAKNASYGAKNSHHKERDPLTGYANARDISITGGTDDDYATLRSMLLNNDRVREWFRLKKWGILNELTKEILSRTKGTGRHLHAGPDVAAVRTWGYWIKNPNISVTKIIPKGWKS